MTRKDIRETSRFDELRKQFKHPPSNHTLRRMGYSDDWMREKINNVRKSDDMTEYLNYWKSDKA